MATLLPLLPLFAILLHRLYVHASWKAIGLFCLLSFGKNALLNAGTLAPVWNGLLTLIEFVLLLYFFGRLTAQNQTRYILHLVLVSFTSVAVTLYAVKDTHVLVQYLPMVEAFILTIAAFMALVQLVRDKQLILFKTPVFWIAGGIMAYSGMLILMEVITLRYPAVSTSTLQEKAIMLHLVQVVRFILFTIAVYRAGRESGTGSR
jgi:hypothetical protein